MVGRLIAASLVFAAACSGGGARSTGAGPTGPAAGGAGDTTGGAGDTTGGAGDTTGGAGGGAASAESEPMVEDLAGARAALGKRAWVKGIARNAKLAAAVEGNMVVIYCMDRDTWPAALLGKKVLVIGNLVSSDQFAAQTSPTGEISAGMDGGALMVTHCEPAVLVP